MTLLPLDEAQARLLALAAPVVAEVVRPQAALGRYLRAPLVAGRDQPQAALSAMDGYAIRAADWPGPWRIVDDGAAGRMPSRPIGTGEATRIFTGAMLPKGADTIVMQEDADRDGDMMRLADAVAGPPVAGRFVRPRGHDFSAASVLAPAGVAVTPAIVGLAIMAGVAELAVGRAVRVAILSNGDELVPPGVDPAPGQIPACNGPMIRAMLAALPAECRDGGIIPDRLDAMTAAIREAAAWADVIVTIGGASVGDHDLVRPALMAAGAKIDFWRIAIKPGKPLLAGGLGDAVVIGLPGNPVSAFVTAQLFLLPLVRHLAGAGAGAEAGGGTAIPSPVTLMLGGPLPPTGDRAEFVRARRIGDTVRPMDNQDSAALAALAAADCLIMRPIGAAAANAGAAVPCLLL